MKTVFMPKAMFTKWLKALRSGKYKQTEYELHDAAGYCCLGVLQQCTTGAVEKKAQLPTLEWLDKNKISFFNRHGNIARSPLLGRKCDADELNDSGYNFKEIAARLERYYGGATPPK